MTQAGSNHKHLRTLRLRVKDKQAAELSHQAQAVNFVWNYVNELSERSIRERGEFLSVFDMLHSHTMHKICASCVQAGIQFRKLRLAMGIDPGCKDAATTGDGDILHGRWYRANEKGLAKAQRAGKKRQTKECPGLYMR